MKFTISRDALLKPLNLVAGVVERRQTLPILSNVLMAAEKSRLSLSTTDLEVSVRTSVDAKVSRAGATTLPARRIFSIFRELSADEIEIDVSDKDVATIRSGASLFKVIGISDDEFPPLPKFKGGEVSLAFVLPAMVAISITRGRRSP